MNNQIATRLQESELSGFWSNSTSPYELVPVAIIATLLCVVAAVAAYRFVGLFFGKRRTFFGSGAGSEVALQEEIRRLKQQVATLEGEKVALFEQNQKSQRRLSEQQREIEVLQGALNERRAELDREGDELEALQNHAKHLEKQLEEIMIELERIYRNAPEKPSPGPEPVPFAARPLPSVDPTAHLEPPPDASADEAAKLKAILAAYRQKVVERRAK